MEPVLFQYRSRKLTLKDINFIKNIIRQNYSKGRTHISRLLCKAWDWKQPNDKYKEYAARDLLLRLEENGFIELPPRLSKNNNRKVRSFDQIPLFINEELLGTINDFPETTVKLITTHETYLWNYLIHNYHYLGLIKPVGEYLRYIAFIDDQVVACLLWASAAWKIKARDQTIGWSEAVKRKNLCMVANNSRFLILPWINVKCLASKILSLCLKRLSNDWMNHYAHPIYLAETFVDNTRFKGTCYKASNWQYAGITSGSAKKGNAYKYHGQPKDIYLYPLHRRFRNLLKE